MTNRKPVLAGFCAFTFFLTNVPTPARAQVVEVGAVGRGGAPVVAPLGLPGAANPDLTNPALSGGISLSVGTLPGANAPLIQPRNAAVAVAGRADILPALAPRLDAAAPMPASPAPANTAVAHAPAAALAVAVAHAPAPALSLPAALPARNTAGRAVPGEIQSWSFRGEKNAGSMVALGKFASGIASPGGTYKPGAARANAAFFDGRVRAADDTGTSAQPPAGSFDGITGNAGGGSGNGLVPPAGDDAQPGGGRLSSLYPRVVFLLDVFTGPASVKTAEYVQSLLDAGVHVVFMTWRPQKGADSAESVLLDKVKHGRANPLIVVSFNGGRIALHSRAANPAPQLEDVGSFRESDIATFRGINAKAAQALGLEAPAETALPDAKSAFSYSVSLPASVPDAEVAAKRGALLESYNAELQRAGLPFRMAAHPSDGRAILMQSMPLRFSLNRVLAALDHAFPGETFLSNPGKWLVLTDSKRSPKFTAAFPKEAEIQVARGGAGVEEVLGAVLGERKLDTVSLKLGKLRQFVEYWEPSRRFASEGTSGSGAPGGSGIGGRPNEREAHQKGAMFAGGVVYQLMAWLYEQVWRGQHQLTTLTQVQNRLREMWRNPIKYRVPVSKTMAQSMKTDSWKGVSRGYLEYANSFVTQFYIREFGDYSAGARNVQDNLVGLSTDRKSLITLPFSSPSTSRLYKIHTRIPRVMKRDTADGRALIAYAYRTGKEVADDGEEIYAKILAMSMLVGHGRKGVDGRWHHGSPDGLALNKLVVQFEYRSSHRTWTFDPDELLSVGENGTVTQGPLVQQITSTIERMEADDEYQTHYKEEEERASKDDLKKARKPKAGAADKPAARPAAKPAAKAAAKPHTATRKPANPGPRPRGRNQGRNPRGR